MTPLRGDNWPDAEGALASLPREAVDVLADLAGEHAERVERVVQLLGFGSRNALVALGLAVNVGKSPRGRIHITDRLWPVMAAAALTKNGIDPTRSAEQILTEVDEAVRIIGQQDVDDAVHDDDHWQCGSGHAELVATANTGEDRARLGAASFFMGIVDRVVRGRTAYAVIEVRGQLAQVDQSVVALSSRDRFGRDLSAGEKVRFQLEDAPSGSAIAVNVQPA